MRMGIADNRRTAFIRGLDTGLRRSAIFITFVLLAAAHTWPLASAPARLSRNDNADAQLNEWIVAWVQHQVVRQPSRVPNANIFYPEPRTLAYSEFLALPALIGAPVRAAGGSPVLVYNLLILAGFSLTGFAGFSLVARWTGNSWAGLVAGSILAFNAHTLTRLPQLQALHLELLPIAILVFDRMLDRRAEMVTWAFGLGALTALQGFTSYYGLVLLVTALATGWLVRAERRNLPSILTAAAVALLLMAPLVVAYRSVGQVRGLDEVAAYSAAARDYLATPARIHFETWSARFFGGTTALFPGAITCALSLVAITSGVAIRDRRARMALAFAVAGVALSFGPALPGYAFLYRVCVPLQGVRNAARFGYLLTVGGAILSGFGAAWLGERCRSRTWSRGLMIALVIAVNIDAFAGPIEYVDTESVSPLHASLAGSDAIVAEIPLYPVDRVFRNAPYLLHSTKHWRPMVNGYSGFTPDSYVRLAREIAHFPDAHALETLKGIGVTHVFVHDRALRDWTDNETADAVPNSPGLELIARDGELSLYKINQ